jgi:hypothetical protein
MSDQERLLHYVLGIVQGRVEPADPDDPLAAAWEEYKRLGHDPLAQVWPVRSLAPPVDTEVLDEMRLAYAALNRWVEEHGTTPETHTALTGMARMLGEPPPARPGVDTRSADEIIADSLIAASEDATLCQRCRIMDDVEAHLVERDGKPWCVRCESDGSLAGLRA